MLPVLSYHIEAIIQKVDIHNMIKNSTGMNIVGCEEWSLSLLLLIIFITKRRNDERKA